MRKMVRILCVISALVWTVLSQNKKHVEAPRAQCVMVKTPAYAMIDNSGAGGFEYIQTPSIGNHSTELVARCAYAEAGNQPEEGVRAVVDVIRNRVNDPRFPNTYEEVILQTGQFSVVTYGTIYAVTVPDDFLKIVEDQLISESVIGEDYIYFNGTPIGSECIQIHDHWFGK